MNIKLGEKIRQLRKQKNISQEVLAQYLGVSFQAVHNLFQKRTDTFRYNALQQEWLEEKVWPRLNG